MPYAEGRVYNDADAHVMEPASWLADYADARTRALLRPLDLSKAGKMAEHALRGKFDAGHWDEVDIEKNLMFVKGWEALGAFNSTERIRRPRSAWLQPAISLPFTGDESVLGRLRTARA